jgi:hypothetical protein
MSLHRFTVVHPLLVFLPLLRRSRCFGGPVLEYHLCLGEVLPEGAPSAKEHKGCKRHAAVDDRLRIDEKLPH